MSLRRVRSLRTRLPRVTEWRLRRARLCEIEALPWLADVAPLDPRTPRRDANDDWNDWITP